MSPREALVPIVEDLALRLKASAEETLPRWLEGRRAAAAAGAAVLLLVAGWALWRGERAPKPFLAAMPAAKIAPALAAAHQRLRSNPQDIKALVEAGVLHFQLGKEHYPEAINELEEARDLGALDPRLFYCLGAMYQEVGLYPFALEEYRRFLRHYPDDREIRLLAAKLLYLQGGFADAVVEYERLKFRHPNDPLVEENLGLSLLGAKNYDRAIESFTQLRQLGPDQARRADFYLGQIDYERGDFKSAQEHFAKAAGEPPASIPGIPDERVLPLLATTYQKLVLLPEAKAAWERLLELTPNDAKAKAAVREINRRLPKPKKKG